MAATLNGENAPPNNLPLLDECLATPFQCIPERVGLAATVWAILATEKLNVFSPFPVASVSPSSLTFAGQQVGTTSPAQTVTLSNTGSVSLAISSITTSGDFAQTNDCGSSMATGDSCTVSVTFTPTTGGTNSGGLSFTDNADNSPQTVALSGTGQDFTMATAPGSSVSVTVAQGGTATYTLAVSGLGGFSQNVNFTCTGAPSKSTCTVSPNPLTPGSSATNITVTVTTTAPSVSAPQSRPLPPAKPVLPGPGSLVMLALALAGAAWVVRSWRQPEASRRRTVFLTLAAGLLLTLATAACGGGGGGGAGGGNPGTPAGTYTLTVTGSTGSGSATLSHSVTLTLTVT